MAAKQASAFPPGASSPKPLKYSVFLRSLAPRPDEKSGACLAATITKLLYIALSEGSLIGFYTLVVGEARYEDAPERLTKGLARHPIPLMLLARMGVALSRQGKGIGAGLLKDAMLRTLAAADIAGIRAFSVHAKDERARDFHRRFDFIESPTDPMHLFVLIKDFRQALD